MASQNSVNIFYGNKELPTPKEWVEKPSWNQVHGIRSSEVTAANQELGDSDSTWTRIPDFKVGVKAADCVPILLACINPSNGENLRSGCDSFWLARHHLSGLISTFLMQFQMIFLDLIIGLLTLALRFVPAVMKFRQSSSRALPQNFLKFRLTK